MLYYVILHYIILYHIIFRGDPEARRQRKSQPRRLPRDLLPVGPGDAGEVQPPRASAPHPGAGKITDNLTEILTKKVQKIERRGLQRQIYIYGIQERLIKYTQVVNVALTGL